MNIQLIGNVFSFIDETKCLNMGKADEFNIVGLLQYIYDSDQKF